MPRNRDRRRPSKGPKQAAIAKRPVLIPARVGGFLRGRYGWWLALAAVLAATWLAYMWGLGGPWLLDDYGNIVNNGALALHHLSWAAIWHAMWSFKAGPLGRPISLASFALERYFFGLHTYPFKATNLALHLASAVLLAGFTRALLRAWRIRFAPQVSERRVDWTALAVAAVWALHPVNLTAVLYAIQRETVLAGLFTFAGLWAYVALRRRYASTWPVVLLLAFVIGASSFFAAYSKESGALLPLLALLLELTVLGFADPDGESRRGRLGLLYLFVMVLPGIAALVWIMPSVFAPGAYATREFNLPERVLTEGRVVVFYLRMMIAPWLPAMTLYHDDIRISTSLFSPLTTFFSFLLIGALLAGGWLLRRRAPLVSLGVLWFFAAQALESTIFPLELAYEHRLYIAGWGIVLAAAGLTLLRARRTWLRELVAAATVLAVAALGLATAARAWHWRSALPLARFEARNHPHSPRSTYLLSRIYTNLALDGERRYLPLAYEASAKAAKVPGAGLDPWVAMVLLAAQTGGQVKGAWFEGMTKAVAKRPFTVSDVNAFEALVGCITRHECKVPRVYMERLFAAIDASPRLDQLGMNYANVLVTEANYIGYATPAERTRSSPLLEKAAEVQPDVAQFQENVFNVAIADKNLSLAKKMLARVEHLNRLGKLDYLISQMRSRLASAEVSAPTTPAGATAPSPSSATAASSGSLR